MEDIILKHLEIVNFKGVKKKNIEFSDSITSIYGDNATGKTTIFDAFLWLLFGKDSNGAAAFNLKPQDSEGNPIPKMENEVTATFMVSGRKVVFRRTHKEKWVTRRGESEPVFQGHTTEYMVDEVPLSQKDYLDKVNAIVSEDVFRLITSPSHFNSLPWDTRRKILFEIVPDVDISEVAKSKKEFQELMDYLAGKDLEEFKKEIKQKIKKAKEAMKDIPARIDELNRNKPEAVDEKAINKEVAAKEKQIEVIESEIADATKASEASQKKRQELINKKYAIQREVKAFEADVEDKRFEAVNEHKRRARQLSADISNAKQQVTNTEQVIATKESRLSTLKKERLELLQEWEKENATKFEFDENTTVCKACGQDLPNASDMEENARANFAKQKKSALDRITAAGQEKNTAIEALEKEIKELQDTLKGHKEAAETLQATLDKHNANQPEAKGLSEDQAGEIKRMQDDIDALDKKLEADDHKPDTEAQYARRKELRNEIDALKSKLSVNAEIERTDKRIDELDKEEKSLAQQIANLEQKEFTIQELIKARIDAIEDKINAKFEYVQFRMFDQQINEGVKETCVTLINGVPFPDANNAGRINAGIDIINVLCDHYSITAPIFIDNRESVVDLLPTSSQVINLYVSEKDKELRVA